MWCVCFVFGIWDHRSQAVIGEMIRHQFKVSPINWGGGNAPVRGHKDNQTDFYQLSVEA